MRDIADDLGIIEVSYCTPLSHSSQLAAGGGLIAV